MILPPYSWGMHSINFSGFPKQEMVMSDIIYIFLTHIYIYIYSSDTLPADLIIR